MIETQSHKDTELDSALPLRLCGSVFQLIIKNLISIIYPSFVLNLKIQVWYPEVFTFGIKKLWHQLNIL